MNEPGGMTSRIIRFCLDNVFVVAIVLVLVVAWGVRVAPFDWRSGDFTVEPDSSAQHLAPLKDQQGAIKRRFVGLHAWWQVECVGHSH